MRKSNMKCAVVNCPSSAVSPVFYRMTLAQRDMRVTSVSTSQAPRIEYNDNVLGFYKKLLDDIQKTQVMLASQVH
jgi:hypothetical protein